jgi:hypothetical protein
MLFLAKQILEKYKSLLLYKFDDQATNSTSNSNFGALIWCWNFLGFELYFALTWMYASLLKVHSFSWSFHLYFHRWNQSLWKGYVQNVCKSNYELWTYKWIFSNLPCYCESHLWLHIHGLDFLNLTIAWNMWDFNFFLTHMWFINTPTNCVFEFYF